MYVKVLQWMVGIINLEESIFHQVPYRNSLYYIFGSYVSSFGGVQVCVIIMLEKLHNLSSMR